MHLAIAYKSQEGQHNRLVVWNCHDKVPFDLKYGCPLLPEIYLIDPWLLGEKGKPVIIRDADKTLHFEPILVLEKLAQLGLLGM